MSISLAWDKDFPKGYGHTSVAYLKRCSGFTDAKNGDLCAAQFVVCRCVKQERLTTLRERYPNAVLLPVLGKNKLPLAFAQLIGLPVCHDVHLLHTVSRKLLGSFQRLLHKPSFVGYIRREVAYILVDDVVTQGGTIAALREFVMVRGGKVAAVVALAFAAGSYTIAPTKEHMVRLFVKFGPQMILLLRILGVAFAICELTDRQTKYLLRFASVRNMVRKLAAA